ncbi:hypothetical protein C8R45DRAFT_1130529 [Mycena sanguinolenta]|nr:hypothetical protein C8R45DRAFT_1130529 [Mycena sanguinolenta]
MRAGHQGFLRATETLARFCMDLAKEMGASHEGKMNQTRRKAEWRNQGREGGSGTYPHWQTPSAATVPWRDPTLPTFSFDIARDVHPTHPPIHLSMYVSQIGRGLDGARASTSEHDVAVQSHVVPFRARGSSPDRRKPKREIQKKQAREPKEEARAIPPRSRAPVRRSRKGVPPATLARSRNGLRTAPRPPVRASVVAPPHTTKPKKRGKSEERQGQGYVHPTPPVPSYCDPASHAGSCAIRRECVRTSLRGCCCRCATLSELVGRMIKSGQRRANLARFFEGELVGAISIMTMSWGGISKAPRRAAETVKNAETRTTRPVSTGPKKRNKKQARKREEGRVSAEIVAVAVAVAVVSRSDQAELQPDGTRKPMIKNRKERQKAREYEEGACVEDAAAQLRVCVDLAKGRLASPARPQATTKPKKRKRE